jgi:hypothetical protein
MPIGNDQDPLAQTQSVARGAGVTIAVTLVMFVLAAGLEMAIYFGIGHVTGGDAFYFGGAIAIFAVAFVCARKGLASRPQCTIAALVIGMLVMAFALTIERHISILPFTYLLLAVPAWLGASPRIHAAVRR